MLFKSSGYRRALALNMVAQYSYEWGQTDRSANTSLMNARHSVVVSIFTHSPRYGNLEIQSALR